MLASEVITLGAAIFGLLTSIAGSSACFYNSCRTNRINLSILKVRLQSLENLIDSVQQKLNGIDVLKPDPSPWINHAKQFLTKVNIPNLESRLKDTYIWVQCGVARSIEAKIQELDVLLENGKRVSREIRIKGSKQPEVVIIGNSREKTRKRMWEQISGENNGVSTVCVYGVARVGKTALASVIHNQALVEISEFETVIWVSIEYGSGLRHIQEELASKLHVDISGAVDNAQRSKTLRNSLIQKGKFLLVLDSVWHAFLLHDIGISEPVGGSKLIITSRTNSLCRKITKKFARKEIYEIKPLSENEAWELFKGEMGPAMSELEEDKETLHIAEVAVKDLDGLPLAVTLLAEILSDIHDDHPNKVNNVWKEELTALSGSTLFLGNKTNELLDCFRFSYENLGEAAMSAFKYCALFPKGYLMNVKQLIEYWMWEGILGEMTSSLDETLVRGRKVLNELKDANLLENVVESGKEDSVRMLKIISHVAADVIVKSGHKYFIQSGINLSEFPVSNRWPTDTERASFVQNQLNALCNGPNCNKLTSLLLQHNPLNNPHYENFFSKIRSLKILDLSNTGIESFPRSLTGLTNLNALLLRNCPNLKSSPSLSTLRKLIVIDLSETHLEKFPEGIQYLTGLRRLNLSQTKLNYFPAQIIDKLTNLEELFLITAEKSYVWGSKQIFPQWLGSCVEELIGLKQLVILQVTFLNAKVFNRYVSEIEEKHSSLPRKFKFCVGSLYTGTADVDVGDNSISVVGDYNIRLPEKTSVLNLMNYSQKITSLKLEGCIRDLKVIDVSNFDELTYLLTVEMLGNLRNLNKICVKRCANMKGIIQPNEEGNPPSITLQGLMMLTLFDLPELENVCVGEVLNCPHLRGVEVWNCDKLKLPGTLLGRNGGILEIRGDKNWLEKAKSGIPSSRSTFKFSEASVPDEHSSTPRFRVRRQESFVTETQPQSRSIFGGFTSVSFANFGNNEGDKNASSPSNITSMRTIGKFFNFKSGIPYSSSFGNLRSTIDSSDTDDSVSLHSVSEHNARSQVQENREQSQ